MAKEFLSADFSGIMSDSNLAGIKLEKQVVPKILEKEYGQIDAAKGFLPNSDIGIQYDLVSPSLRQPGKVIWSTMVRQGHFNKNFQKNVGELLFLKKYFPKVESILVFGLYAAKASQIKRATNYLKAYALLWDKVFIVKSPDPLKYDKVTVQNDVKNLASMVLNRELDKIRNVYSKRRYCEERVISLPSISGFSEDCPCLASFILEKKQWLTNFEVDSIKKFISEFSKKFKLQDGETKTLESGLTTDLIYDSIVHAFESLKTLSDGSKMRKIVETGDPDKFYKYMHGHGNPAKRWDYFNPSEALVALKLQRTFGKEKVEWSPTGIPVNTFLHEMGVFNRPWSWDVQVKGNPPIFIEVKALSGYKGGSGPKQAGYEAHRVSCRGFLSRYSIDINKNEFQENKGKNIVILDGFWSGPAVYPHKNADFFIQIGGFENAFLIDHVESWVNFIQSTTSF